MKIKTFHPFGTVNVRGKHDSGNTFQELNIVVVSLKKARMGGSIFKPPVIIFRGAELQELK